ANTACSASVNSPATAAKCANSAYSPVTAGTLLVSCSSNLPWRKAERAGAPRRINIVGTASEGGAGNGAFYPNANAVGYTSLQADSKLCLPSIRGFFDCLDMAHQRHCV